jgi:hypothetical protein
MSTEQARVIVAASEFTGVLSARPVDGDLHVLVVAELFEHEPRRRALVRALSSTAFLEVIVKPRSGCGNS